MFMLKNTSKVPTKEKPSLLSKVQQKQENGNIAYIMINLMYPPQRDDSLKNHIVACRRYYY
jgi:hypothetical protein